MEGRVRYRGKGKGGSDRLSKGGMNRLDKKIEIGKIIGFDMLEK